MGAYSYCKHPECFCAMPPATAREVLEGEQTCIMGHSNEPNRTEKDVIIELVERIEALERVNERAER